MSRNYDTYKSSPYYGRIVKAITSNRFLKQDGRMNRMRSLLIVVDMQNDFVSGALGTKEAKSIVDNIKFLTSHFIANGDSVIFTRDTHDENYLNTSEGKHLPIPHCLKSTHGWELIPELSQFTHSSLKNISVWDKNTIGSEELAYLVSLSNNLGEAFESIVLVGVCTDICVISNAILLKAYCPNVRIIVDASCCAGSTPLLHEKALDVMKSCQIEVVGMDDDRSNFSD